MTTLPAHRGNAFDRRDEWVELLARLTDGFVRAIPSGGSPARALLPGAPAGDPVPAIEGFARMSVAWGAWLHDPGNPPTLRWRGREHDVAVLLARGLADATNPDGNAWWGGIGDRDQRIVEAAEVATCLVLGGDRLRRALDAVAPETFERVLDWLADVDGKDLWPDNWVLFPVLPALIRRRAGRPIDLDAIDAALDWMVAHTVGDGWTSDGAGHALDLYSGWAIHWHLLWWVWIDGSRRPRLAADIRRRARAWLRFAATLVAEDGGFPRFGRSLGYRFAIAAPFTQAALLDIDPLPAGAARSVAGRIVGHGLASGAVDPATDWFRIGVGATRPEVVEGYVSAGASAWAAHALVALAMPASHPFWEAPRPDAPPTRGSRTSAAAAAGLLGARAGGGTVLHNARVGHPADIADHDYAATYGKLAYRSAFPFDVPVASRRTPGSDDALVAVEPGADPTDSSFAHRNESIGGSAGSRWILSRYDLPTRDAVAVRTAVVLVGGVEVRVHAIGGRSTTRLRDGGAALGTAADEAIEVTTDDAAGIVSVAGAGKVVAIRRLLGFGRIGTSGPGSGRMNLVHDRSIHPWVEESIPSASPRVVASATVAGIDAPAEAIARLGAVSISRIAGGRIAITAGTGPSAETAIVDLGRRPALAVPIAGRTVRGPGVRVAVADLVGHAIGGERIASIDGVATLARPGSVWITHDDEAIEVTAAAGIRLEPSWSGGRPRWVRVVEVGGRASVPIRLAEAGVAPDRLVRGEARRLGTRLVSLRFETGR